MCSGASCLMPARLYFMFCNQNLVGADKTGACESENCPENCSFTSHATRIDGSSFHRHIFLEPEIKVQNHG